LQILAFPSAKMTIDKSQNWNALYFYLPVNVRATFSSGKRKSIPYDQALSSLYVHAGCVLKLGTLSEPCPEQLGLLLNYCLAQAVCQAQLLTLNHAPGRKTPKIGRTLSVKAFS
jgi:hypothetical protein